MKIIKNSTWEAKQKEIIKLENDLKIVKDREEKFKVSNAERGERIHSLQAEKDACKAMRHDLSNKVDGYKEELIKSNTALEDLKVKNKLNAGSLTESIKQVDSLKSDLSNQRNELVVANDQVKQLQRSLDQTAKKVKDMEANKTATDETNMEIATAYSTAQSKNTILNLAIAEAMTEMRKIGKGRPSHNKSRAFQILEVAIAKMKTEA